MKIKEVEEKTHLTKKTIRFYEEKGLLTVARDQSGYRDYTSADIEKLLAIKLFRKCGMTLDEIENIFIQKSDLKDVLYFKINEYDKKNLELSVQRELCLDVIKADGQYQELYKQLEFLDSNEYYQFVDEMIDDSKISLAKQIFSSLIFLGPILSTFLFLSIGQYQRLWIGIPLSIGATIFLTISWRKFMSNYRFQKERIWQGLRHFIGMFLMLIISLVVVFGIIIGMNILQTYLYMQGHVYIISTSRFHSFVSIIFAFEIWLIMMSYFSRFLKHKDYHEYDFLWSHVKKHPVVLTIVNVMIVYFALTGVTTISQSRIVVYSPIHPQGVVYQYSDIQKVETGFYKNRFLFFHDAGDFYYHVTMKDGKVIELIDTQTTAQYENDTYSELVVFDQQVMMNHPLKISSSAYCEYAMLDQVYIDRFISIVENK